MIGRATIKRFAREIVSTVSFYCGYSFLTSLLGRRGGARILCYHAINDTPANSFAVSSHNFEKQMKFLVEHYSIISVDQMVELLKEGKELPHHLVSITIDDGYEDTYTHAFRILKELSIPATIFLPVGFIENSTSERIKKRLPQNDFLSWRQIKEMSLNGITFGSHTLDHISLTDISRWEAQHQLISSKSMIEAEIGSPVTGFAYPYGTVRDFNPEIKQLVKDGGYSWAVSGLSGVNTSKTDLFVLRRTKVERDDGMIIFQRALRGGLDPWIVVDKFGWFLQARNR